MAHDASNPEPGGAGTKAVVGVGCGMKITDSLFLQRHGEKIEATLGCYDRLVITGTLLDVAYPAAVQHWLNERGLRCFELGEFAEPLREAVRENAQALAKEAGLEIEHLLCKGARK